jgi:hypothetical protein
MKKACIGINIDLPIIQTHGFNIGLQRAFIPNLSLHVKERIIEYPKSEG